PAPFSRSEPMPFRRYGLGRIGVLCFRFMAASYVLQPLGAGKASVSFVSDTLLMPIPAGAGRGSLGDAVPAGRLGAGARGSGIVVRKNKASPEGGLRARRVVWSGRSDSDRRQQPWQGCALPAELRPREAV